MLIALTGWGQEDDRRRTGQAGFNHHLLKPADMTSLTSLFKALGNCDYLCEGSAVNRCFGIMFAGSRTVFLRICMCDVVRMFMSIAATERTACLP